MYADTAQRLSSKVLPVARSTCEFRSDMKAAQTPNSTPNETRNPDGLYPGRWRMYVFKNYGNK